MKPQEFLKENEFIGDDAHQMHKSHQLHMLREECYHSAANAIKLHKLLGELPEGHDLDAWAAEKISLANDYLKTVTEWLEYDVMGGTNEAMMAGGMEAFSMESAERQYAELLGEDQGVAEERTEVKDKDGNIIRWSEEDKWEKSTDKKNPRGQVTNLSDRARRETEKLNKQPTVAEGQEQTPDQVRQTLNAWMNKDQQFKDPTQRAGFQAKVWPYIQTNINSILSDKGKDGKGGYPAAPYAAWLLVQHMDAYPQNQVKFLQQLGQSGLNPDDKLQFLQDRAAVNQWIAANANNEEYYVNGKPLPNPTVNVRNPAIFKDAGIVANSREEALQNAIDAGNKLLVAAVQATNAQTQPSYKQGVAENTLDQDLDQIAESFESTLSETMSSGVSSIPAVGGGTLFGGSYQNPDNPFKQKKKSVKKSSVIKR